MNKFYLASVTNGIPRLVESTYTIETDDEYIVTARDNQVAHIGWDTKVPAVLPKRDAFPELVYALRHMVIEAYEQYDKLWCLDREYRQLGDLINYATRQQWGE